MIAFLIVSLFTLALFHWAYESAISPSFRLGARYRLFGLRDELRNFSAQKGFQLDRAAIRVLEESINSVIEHMYQIDFGFAFAFSQRCAADNSFRMRVEHRQSVVDSYQDPEFQELRQRYGTIFREITMINSGAWFVYLVPVAAIALFWSAIRQMFIKLSIVSGDDFPALSRGAGEACAEPV